MATYSKLGYGNYGDIDAAVTSGKLDGKDLVITKDTSELIYIKDDGSKQVIQSKTQLFDTVEAATTAINASSETYAGKSVGIKDENGKYQIYIVQTGETGFVVEPIIESIETGFVWQEF